MKRITKVGIWNYFIREMQKNPMLYCDCGEIVSTTLAEAAQQHFEVMTEEGKSDIEQEIFDVAAEFSIKYEQNDFV